MAIIRTGQLLESIQVRQDNLPSMAPRPEEEPQSDTSLGDLLGAAFRTENTVGSTVQYFQEQKDIIEQAPDENFSPFAYIDNDPKYAKAVATANSVDEVKAIMESVDRQEKDREILATSGWAGIAASMTAGILDPINLIPGGIAVQASRVGVAIGKGAATGIVYGAGTLAASEAVLHATQTQRTQEESVYNIVGGALVGGVLGGGIGYLTASKRASTKNLVTEIMQDVDPKLQLDVRPDGNIGAAYVSGKTLKKSESLAGLNDTVTKNLSSVFPFLRSPVVVGLTNDLGKVRQITNELFEHSFILNKNKDFIASDVAVESKIKIRNGESLKASSDVKKLYLRYASINPNKETNTVNALLKSVSGTKLNFDEFSKEIAVALRNGDVHEIPEVARAAQRYRSLMDRNAAEMQKLGLLPEDIDLKTSSSYLTRVYNVQKILQNRDEFVGRLEKHFLSKNATMSPGEAKVAASQAAEEVTRRITGIGSDSLYLDTFMDDILSVPGGGVAKGAGFTKERMLDIPDNMIDDFLVNDAVGIVDAYLKRSDALIEMKKWMSSKGYRNYDDIKGDIRSNADELVRSGDITWEQHANIIKNADETIRQQIEIMTGRFGKHGTDKWERGLQNLRKYQVTTKLGGVVLSSIPDLAMPVFKHGLLNTFKYGYFPMAKKMLSLLKAKKLSPNEWNDIGIGLEIEQNHLLKALQDPSQLGYYNRTKLDRAVDATTSVFGTLSGLPYWNSFGRRVAASVSSSRTLRDIEKFDKLGKADRIRLATLGIDESVAKRIQDQFSKYGDRSSGSFISNTNLWDDLEIRDLFRASVLKDVDSTILLPGKGDVPYIIAKNELAKTLFQFKGFTAAATNKILLNSAQRGSDVHLYTGIMSLVGLGMMVHIIKENLAGREVKEDLDELISEGIERSGVAGMLGETYFAASPWGKSSRYSTATLDNFVLGPSWGTVKDAYISGRNLLNGDLDDADARRMARLLPFQNVFYLRMLFEQFAD